MTRPDSRGDVTRPGGQESSPCGGQLRPARSRNCPSGQCSCSGLMFRKSVIAKSCEFFERLRHLSFGMATASRMAIHCSSLCANQCVQAGEKETPRR